MEEGSVRQTHSRAGLPAIRRGELLSKGGSARFHKKVFRMRESRNTPKRGGLATLKRRATERKAEPWGETDPRTAFVKGHFRGIQVALRTEGSAGECRKSNRPEI